MHLETKYAICAGFGFFLAMACLACVLTLAYPLSFIQNSQGFGFLFEGFGGYYMELNK